MLAAGCLSAKPIGPTTDQASNLMTASQKKDQQQNWDRDA
jgi:hypothetical protein